MKYYVCRAVHADIDLLQRCSSAPAYIDRYIPVSKGYYWKSHDHSIAHTGYPAEFYVLTNLSKIDETYITLVAIASYYNKDNFSDLLQDSLRK